MLRTLVEQFVEYQRQKRDLAKRRWEQEQRWREEDRAVALAARAANEIPADRHGKVMRRMAGVSYITLRCHEDTWTFMAREAFGVWNPAWTQSTYDGYGRVGPDGRQQRLLSVDPNLPPGRVTKGTGGMQDVLVSGHNLVRILDVLRTAARSDDLARGARGRTLYERMSVLADRVDPAEPAARTTGTVVHIDDSLGERSFRDPSPPLTATMSVPPWTPAGGGFPRDLPALPSPVRRREEASAPRGPHS